VKQLHEAKQRLTQSIIRLKRYRELDLFVH